MTENKHYESIDLMKGIAIVAIVFIHIIVLQPSTGSGSTNSPVLEIFYSGLTMFFVFTGYFYKSGGSYWKKIKKRAVQIFVPYLICVFILIPLMALYGNLLGYNTDLSDLLGQIVKGITSNAFNMPSFDYNSYAAIQTGWYFLMASFTGMVIFYAIADKVSEDNRLLAVTIAILLAATCAINFATDGMNLPFRIQIAPLAAAFMLFGWFLRKNDVAELIENGWKTKKYWILLITALVVGVLLALFLPTGMRLSENQFGEYGGWSVFPFYLLNISCGYVLWCLCGAMVKAKPLSKIFGIAGRYSLFIILLHTFFIKLISAPFFGLSNTSCYPTMPIWACIIFAITAIILSILSAYVCHVIKIKIIEMKCTQNAA